MKPEYNFAVKRELLEFLGKDKDEKTAMLIANKKASMKMADGIFYPVQVGHSKDSAHKANKPVATLGKEYLDTRLVINSCNWLDSHGDVHLSALWKRSLKSNTNLMHLQEHCMAFDKIISSGKNLSATTEEVSWKELGYKASGTTECLVFYSNILKARNEYMFEQYAKGYVTNHSVGMQYVSMVLCVNEDDEYYGAEYEAWQKYYPVVINKDAADERGYFWAVKEAKAIEGSAVPAGSNIMTPTLDNDIKGGPAKGHSPNQPAKTTGIDYLKLAAKFKL